MNLPDLHRVGAVPDWETVPEEDWNEYQIRAAATNGWDTPGNRETLKGAIATLTGLALIYADTPMSNLAGTVAIGWGRWKDIQDGKRAAETDTKSPLGEALDAGTDTLLMATALPILVKKGTLSRSESSIMLGIIIGKSLATITAKRLGREIHATRAGKVSTFLQWGGIGMSCVSLVAKNMEEDTAKQATTRAARLINRFGMTLGLVSAAGYIKDAATPKIT